MNYKKDDLITLTIESMGTEGEGIGKIDGFPFFIKDAVKGDVVRAKVMKVKKNYAFARLVEIILPSLDRVEPGCPSARACGGCQIQHVSYEAQLRFKENKVFHNLCRIGGIPEEDLKEVFEPIAGMESPWRYRNKAQYPVGYDKNGRITAGFYAGRTHSIIPCTDCLLGPVSHGKILDAVIRWMEKYHIKPYDEKQGQGLVRHILIREGFATGEIMVCLVVNMVLEPDGLYNAGGCADGMNEIQNAAGVSSVVRGQRELIQNLTKIAGVCSILLNSNCSRTNVILGTKCLTIYGKDYIEDILGDFRFRISPLAFYQVNPVQTWKLYQTALEFADLKGDEEVWDICCGIGTITLFLARRARFVHGLEIVPEAIADAWINAEINGISNVEFIAAPAEEYMPAHRENIRADIIVTDPPRKGMDVRSLDVMVEMAPAKIIYVSCDSATLARDLKYLREKGYEVRRVRAVDMFPMTGHVEAVVMLSHKKPDSVINVKVEFGEGEGKVPLDNIAKRAEAYKPKERVTYKMIKEYIEAKYGFKVHTAYIAEVKRELGLPMYDAPNAVEELKQPRKHPTAEKVEAIKDALKHFGITK